MPELPLITAVLTVPGLSSRHGRNEAASSPVGETLSIGLVLDNERVAWGVCPFPAGSPLSIDTAVKSIQRRVAPALQGKRLAGFRELAAKIDELTESVTIREALPQPESDNQAGKFSRRDLFTGRLWSADLSPGPKTRQVAVERPVAAAIRHGASQALLAAVALAQNKSVAETIVAEYGLPAPASAVPVHVSLGPPGDEASLPVNALLARQVASLGYTIAAHDDKAQIGSSGERLQQQVRRLQEQIAAATPAYQPMIHLDLGGAFGRLFDDNPGKILGALVGLEQAAAPYPVRVVDAVVRDSRQAQIERLRQLKAYLRMRRLRLQLVAAAWVDSIDAVADFSEAGAVHAIQLDAPRLGSLHRTIEAILAGRKQSVATQLADSSRDGHSAQLLAHVALATQPQAIIALGGLPDLALIHNEMARTLAWIGRDS